MFIFLVVFFYKIITLVFLIILFIILFIFLIHFYLFYAKNYHLFIHNTPKQIKLISVIYDGCPRSPSESIWWPRTNFGLTAIETCPRGSHGKASRSCDNLLGGWQPPDLFNCTSDRFVELRTQLSLLEVGDLQLNTFVAIQLASDLRRATNLTERLYGADVLITYDLIRELLKYESSVYGLNLTHSQDKDYIMVSFLNYY